MANFQNCAAHLLVSAPAPKPGETATLRIVAHRGGVRGEHSPILTACLPSEVGAAANTVEACSAEDVSKRNESTRQVARFHSHTVKRNDTQALGIMACLETKAISLTPHVESIYVQPRP